MKRVVIIVALIIGLAGPLWAGEKEELQLKQALLQEIQARARFEGALAQIQGKEVAAQLKAVQDREKSSKQEKGK